MRNARSEEELAARVTGGLPVRAVPRMAARSILQLDMVIMQVNVHVMPERIEEFQQATIANATNSVREEGIARFDVLQSAEDPSRFMLVEVYRHEQAMAAHKNTAHYHAWVEKVTAMLAEPRTRAMYRSIFPEEQGW
jgi:autoinducer 2-degrading protein